MQRLEVSGAVRPIYGSLGVKRLTTTYCLVFNCVKTVDTPKSVFLYLSPSIPVPQLYPKILQNIVGRVAQSV